MCHFGACRSPSNSPLPLTPRFTFFCAQTLVQNARLRPQGNNLLVLPTSAQLGAAGARYKPILVSGAELVLVLPHSASSSNTPFVIAFYIQHQHSFERFRCTVNVAPDFIASPISCAPIDSDSRSTAVISANIKKLDFLTTPDIFNVVSVELSEGSAELLISVMPVSQEVAPAFLLSLRGQAAVEAQGARVGYMRRLRARLEERFSAARSFSSDSLLSPVWVFILGFIGLIMVLVALVLKMLVGSKTQSVTPPKAGNVSPISPSNSPASLGEGNALNGSGLHSSSGAHSHSPVTHHLGSSGVISFSISHNKKGHYTGSPTAAEVPLHGGVISASKFSASPPSKASSLGVAAGGLQASGYVSVTTAGSARSQTNSFAVGSESPPSHASTASSGSKVIKNAINQATAGMAAMLSKKNKTEKVALVEPLLSPKVRGYAPAVVANTTLAALPNEPQPKPKTRYLASIQSSKKTSARRPVRYQDFVPTPSQMKYGTYSKVYAEKQDRRRKLSEFLDDSQIGASSASPDSLSSANHLPSGKGVGHAPIIAVGGIESVLGDEDGPGGLFVDDDGDDWLTDVVEPDPNDPIYKNDTQYTHIDVDTLKPVDDSVVDFSLQCLETHISAIASPLTRITDRSSTVDCSVNFGSTVASALDSESALDAPSSAFSARKKKHKSTGSASTEEATSSKGTLRSKKKKKSSDSSGRRSRSSQRTDPSEADDSTPNVTPESTTSISSPASTITPIAEEHEFIASHAGTAPSSVAGTDSGVVTSLTSQPSKDDSIVSSTSSKSNKSTLASPTPNLGAPGSWRPSRSIKTPPTSIESPSSATARGGTAEKDSLPSSPSFASDYSPSVVVVDSSVEVKSKEPKDKRSTLRLKKRSAEADAIEVTDTNIAEQLQSTAEKESRKDRDTEKSKDKDRQKEKRKRQQPE